MRHDALGPVADAPQVLRELAEFLDHSGSAVSLDEALACAIREWIAARSGDETITDRAPASRRPGGYQWKCLFLPHGSQLRIFFSGCFHYAEVKDDMLVHANRPVSPRQFLLAVACEGRNAWRDLDVRRPGDARWRPASLLRRELETGKVQPESPIAAMRDVAAVMAETLKTAQAVIEHANSFALPKFDRRGARARRADDVLAELCQSD